jgi:demethylmenaquinone methyltransferase/2-methoxy-6-polyprenyl-1,4-benzoquinol methylase
MNLAEKEKVVGAAPVGTSDRESAARAVREMFTSIAPRYDLLNHVLSLNIDRLWWWRTARRFDHILKRPGASVLDLCCGTGDMAFAMWRRARSADRATTEAGEQNAEIVGVDFSHAMLRLAAQKGNSARGSNQVASPRWVEADALRLPFPDAHFDLVTSAFGFRNLADYDAGLREIARVLTPGGECGILDFSEPTGLLGEVYRIYFKKVLPAIGTMISGVRGPYAYLPASVERFPSPEEMTSRMKRSGFSEASWTAYTMGIAGLYWGVKAQASRLVPESGVNVRERGAFRRRKLRRWSSR